MHKHTVTVHTDDVHILWECVARAKFHDKKAFHPHYDNERNNDDDEDDDDDQRMKQKKSES